MSREYVHGVQVQRHVMGERPEALYIMELPWAEMWPLALGSRDELCNHTDGGWESGYKKRLTIA